MRIENLHEVPRFGVTNFPRQTWFAYNRTGAACLKNGIYAFDVQQTAAQVRSIADSGVGPNSEGKLLPAVTNYGYGDDGAFGNIVLVKGSPITLSGGGVDSVFNGHLPMCVALSAVNANELVEVCVEGEVSLMLTTQGFGTAPGALEPWRRVVATDGVATGVLIAGSTNNLNMKAVAVTLESSSWAASGTQNTVKCYFNGINGAFVGR